MKWTCEGSVRGCCGINHRSHAAALAHCADDDRNCKTGHGHNAYSDRSPEPVDAEAKAEAKQMANE